MFEWRKAGEAERVEQRTVERAAVRENNAAASAAGKREQRVSGAVDGSATLRATPASVSTPVALKVG
jgi:hypothetical protein